MTPQPTHFSIIPSNVLYHKVLSPSAKLLYAQITGLIGERGYCWASNAFFADRNSCSEWTISNLISQLRAEGLLRVEIDKVAGNQRRIYTAETLPLLRKTPRGSCEKSHEGIEKNPNTLLRKTPSRVVKESKSKLVVKVSSENAPAHQNQQDQIQGQGDTSMPSSGAARPTTFADSIWATATTGTFATALHDYDPTTADADAGYYRNRCRDWSAQNPGKPRNWIAFAAQVIGDDRTQSKLVTLKSANHDSDRHTLLTNPLTGNTTNLERVSRAAASAQRVIARRRAAGL